MFLLLSCLFIVGYISYYLHCEVSGKVENPFIDVSILAASALRLIF